MLLCCLSHVDTTLVRGARRTSIAVSRSPSEKRPLPLLSPPHPTAHRFLSTCPCLCLCYGRVPAGRLQPETKQDYFARLPELRLVEYAPASVRVYGDFAAQAGTYTFSWQGAAGDTVEMRSRFSFTFRRDNPGSAQAWTIVEHHSSNMPTSPLELELARVGNACM